MDRTLQTIEDAESNASVGLPDPEVCLSHWEAVQKEAVGESTLGIALYVTVYVTKAGKSDKQDVWQDVSSVQSRLWSFGVRSLQSRECGLYEASDLLLGDHLCGRSLTE